VQDTAPVGRFAPLAGLVNVTTGSGLLVVGGGVLVVLWRMVTARVAVVEVFAASYATARYV
jgi:hypothetical protein